MVQTVAGGGQKVAMSVVQIRLTTTVRGYRRGLGIRWWWFWFHRRRLVTMWVIPTSDGSFNSLTACQILVPDLKSICSLIDFGWQEIRGRWKVFGNEQEFSSEFLMAKWWFLVDLMRGPTIASSFPSSWKLSGSLEPRLWFFDFLWAW
jgi:hypothetical protein